MISAMRTRFTVVLSIAVCIFGGVLLGEVSRPAHAQSHPNIERLPVIAITRDGSLYLNEKAVSINVLAVELKREFPMASEVYVKPDRMTVWEPLSQVLAALNAAKPPIQVRFPLAPGRPNELPEIQK
jgi:biopolymer transport protein ExbD